MALSENSDTSRRASGGSFRSVPEGGSAITGDHHALTAPGDLPMGRRVELEDDILILTLWRPNLLCVSSFLTKKV